jgi:hypothetical protein
MSDRDSARTGDRGIVVTDIDIPFGRLIVILIKLALASIPAMIVVWVVLFVVMMLLGLILGTGSMWHRWMMPWGGSAV